MRVIFTHNVTNDTSTFLKWFIRSISCFVHSVNNTSMNWFHTISNIRDSTSNDNAHCVIKEGLLNKWNCIYIFKTSNNTVFKSFEFFFIFFRNFFFVFSYFSFNFVFFIFKKHIQVSFLLNIQVLNKLSICVNEFFTRINIIAH